MENGWGVLRMERRYVEWMVLTKNRLGGVENGWEVLRMDANTGDSGIFSALLNSYASMVM